MFCLSVNSVPSVFKINLARADVGRRLPGSVLVPIV